MTSKQLRHKLPVIVILFLALVFFQVCSDKNTDTLNTDNSAKSAHLKARFVGTESCKSCHEEEYQSWQGSHHHLAMQTANDSTILADFNTSFTSNDVKSIFRNDSTGYYVTTESENGTMEEYKVIYAFGITPLQQYIVEFPNGAYQCLQTAWDTEKGKWFDLQPNLEITPGEWIHWTGNAMKWNTACADCHSTDLRKNYSFETKSYDTQFKEISVGCEGCHGPASEHVDYHTYSGLRKGKEEPVLYMSKGIDSKDLVQKCARCHSRRSQITKVFDYEGHYLDHYEPQLITWPTYERDGQILDEDYVYASFIQSKMYAEGVACNDCHDMHSMQLKAMDNALCMNCHEPQYNTVEHYFHEPDKEGAQCINCHMTGRTYMGNDFRRDHSFRVPRPDQSVLYGTPNACNGCHTEKTAQWAADFIENKFGAERPEHFSNYLIAGSNGDLEALEHLINSKDYPDIARAAGLNYYAQMIAPDEASKIVRFLKDEMPMVRNEAVRSIGGFGNPNFKYKIEPLLEDTFRTIRKNAAMVMKRLDNRTLNSDEAQKAFAEYQAYLEMNADFPSTQHEMGENYQVKGQTQKAITAYEEALKIDNRYNVSRLNLALLKYQTGKVAEAESLYKTVIKQEPDASYPNYMLGLLKHENGNIDEALTYLKVACEKSPPLPSAFYNYALLLQQNNEYESSLQVIEEGLQQTGTSERLLYIQLLGLMQLERKNEALNVVNQLIQLSPQNQQYKGILQQLTVSE